MNSTPNLDYFLTLNDIDCTTSAWWCINAGILRDSAPRRGENVALYGVDGALPRRRLRDQRTVDLQFVFDGASNRSGTPYADPKAGLLANIEDFLSSVVDAAGNGDGTIDAELDTPNGTYSGLVQIDGDGLVTGPGVIACTATLTITLPDGRLEAVGS